MLNVPDIQLGTNFSFFWEVSKFLNKTDSGGPSAHFEDSFNSSELVSLQTWALVANLSGGDMNGTDCGKKTFLISADDSIKIWLYIKIHKIPQ